jgi:predicted P-loop ATPase
MKTQDCQTKRIDQCTEIQHRKDWLSSKVDPEIIAYNVCSCSGDNAYERLLYALDAGDRRNDGRLRDKWLNDYRHLDHGGWYCNGINLLDFTESDWGCFKPDRPRVRQGKPVKYEHPPKAPAGVFALRVGLEVLEKFARYSPEEVAPDDFWQWVIGSPGIPVTITEGAKKAGCLLSHGHAAIALAGVWNFADDDGALKPEIKALCRPGREFSIAFDQDSRWRVRSEVSRAARKLAGLLEAEGCLVTVLVWEVEDGKGIDDFTAKEGAGELEKIYEERLEFSEFWEKYARPREMKRKDFLEFLQTTMKGRLRWNDLTSRIEWDGEPIELEGSLTYRFLEEFNIDAYESVIVDGLKYEAMKNRYHPVREYLTRCTALETMDLDNLSDRYFGTNEPFYNILVKKWLIGAVARVFEPGCKFDEALILRGSQGAMKSTFFATLGGDWFDDSFGSNIESAKGLMTLHRSWIQEWAEFGRVSKKYDFDTIKGFLSRKTDRFVRQYGRESVDHPRMSVMCGSTNETVFLKDATGDRRFWIVEIPEGWKIPIALVESERDRLWGAAVKAYRAGESRFLGEEEYNIHKGLNEQFRDIDEWESVIVKFLDNRGIGRFSVLRILMECLEFTIDKIDDKSKNRVQRCLQRLNCLSLGSRHETEWDGAKRRVWERPEVIEENHASATPCHASATPCHASATPCHASATPLKREAWQGESQTEKDSQECCHAYHAYGREKLSPHVPEENEPPPEDIHAKIDPRPRCIVDRLEGECRLIRKIRFGDGALGYEVETPLGETKRVFAWIVTILDDEND